MQQQTSIAGIPEEELEEHIVELLNRLKVIFISIALTALFISLMPAKFLEGEFVFEEYTPAIGIILGELLKWATSLAEGQSSFTLTLGAPYSIIIVCIELAIIIAIILNIPIISYEIYVYVRPALYDEEADFAKKLAIAFGILFGMGVFAGFLLVPFMIQTLFSLTSIVDYGKIENFVPLETFVHFIFFSLIGTGLLFTFPLWLIFASIAGLITSDELMERRKQIFIALLAVTAIITPDPTPISMILLSGPLI
ncbi:MAG: twin-arginine translocase subunit TatC, partial [Candidatus Odinarchaeota archaeon]